MFIILLMADKDILVIGNKVYSPETCIFVTREVNALLNRNKAARGEFPQGVRRRVNGIIVAEMMRYGKKIHIGTFDSVKDASIAYNKEKYRYISEVADTQAPIIKKGLMRHAEAYLRGVTDE